MTSRSEFRPFTCMIDRATRVDHHRAYLPGTACLYHAQLKDAGKPLPVVAKESYTAGRPEVVDRLKKCAEIQRSLQEHGSVLRVHGLTVHEEHVIQLLEQAEGSVRDIVTPSTPQ